MTAAAVAGLLVPAGALAAKPSDPGANGQGKSQRCKKTPKVGYTAQGTLVGTPTVAGDQVTLTVAVTKANRHARALKGETVEITVPASAYKYTGTAPAVADNGDRVKLVGRTYKAKKGCPAASEEALSARVRKVVVSEPEAAEEQEGAAQQG